MSEDLRSGEDVLEHDHDLATAQLDPLLSAGFHIIHICSFLSAGLGA